MSNHVWNTTEPKLEREHKRRDRSPTSAVLSQNKRAKTMPKRSTTVTIDSTIKSQYSSKIPRSYQTELMSQAKEENLIVCLPTGSGKTYIAVMLIKEMSNSIRKSIHDGGKRTIFLVGTVALVQQQSEYIATHTDLKVGRYYGELNVDFWERQKWIDEFENHQVLVFTAQVFLNVISHNYFALNKVNLLIFDECHHYTGNSPYPTLMNTYYDDCFDKPRILGLTASISGKKITAVELSKVAKEIEKTYRARLASGSNREESYQHGTSARFEPILCPMYKEQVCQTNESVNIPFHILESILKDLQPYLQKKKQEREQLEAELIGLIMNTDYLEENVNDYTTSSVNYMVFLQSEYVSLPRLQRYIGDLEHIGYELGIYGLYVATKNLRRTLKSSKALELIVNSDGKILYEDLLARIDCLVDDILEPLVEIHQNHPDILFSPKVFELFQRMKKGFDLNHRCLCIVFVERVFTAAVLPTVLNFISEKCSARNENLFKIKYVTGAKSNAGGTTMIAKHQNKVIQEFRQGEINVLIATAVVEEGLDIPKCNLVFRFNKPSNFSSYMQSKGRARAKENAAYVLLIDEPVSSSQNKDLIDYKNYESLEKKIQTEFSIDDDDDELTLTDLAQLEPYRTESGVVINATQAAQLIHQYCAYLGRGALCPPRVLTRPSGSNFICVLSMPANCPVRDDIIFENRSKKLAKFQCCLEMVKLLHQRNELDENCLPYRRQLMINAEPTMEMKIFRLCDQLFETKSDGTIETIPKTILCFPDATTIVEPEEFWFLYRINIRSEKEKLGFIVPTKLPDLPNFELDGGFETNLTVDVTLIKSIEFPRYRSILERFCRYLFEHVIIGIVDSSFEFDVTKSPFKLLPCLLKNLNEIDDERMSSICSRLNKPIENHSVLSTEELYTVCSASFRSLFVLHPENSIQKRTSDLWPHKTTSNTIESYADHFQTLVPNVTINRNDLMVTLRGISRPKINFLNENSLSKKEKKSQKIEPQKLFFPIELLRYAPVNQAEMKLFYKWPSLLVRISQLYWSDKLRTIFAENLDIDLSKNVRELRSAVRFDDFLQNSDLTSQNSFLPLTRLSNETIDETVGQIPSIELIFQSLTRRSCGEKFDNENLEILGDCFLKLIISLSLFVRHGSANAGFLSTEKMKEISNENLYRLVVKNDLKTFFYGEKLEFRGENRNWLPPSFTSNSNLTNQKAKRKAFSDMIEALIGAFLVSTDYVTTIRWMKTIGFDVSPFDQRGQLIEFPSILRQRHERIDQLIEQFLRDRALIDVESTLNYVFRNKAFLIAALTHPSNFANRLTDCYERLEFLGDAVLDFLLTRHIFVHQKEKLTPGRVTDIRGDLSNNNRLAYIVVSLRLHQKILHNSPTLFGLINSFAGDENLFPKDFSTNDFLNRDLDEWAADNAPKALADVFEALVGAIFLDSANSLEIVWNTIEPFLRSYIDKSMSSPNLNPIRSFSEKGGRIIEEKIEEIADENVSICRVQFPDGRIFEGHGQNKKLAKANACRKAMKNFI